MPESKGRRKGGRRSPRARRGGVSAAPGTRHVGARLGESGRPRIRPKTWRRIRRWVFIGGAGLVAVLVIASFALSSFPGGGVGGLGSGASDVVEGVGKPAPIISSDHITFGDTASYTTNPPTSGPHWPPGRQAKCGIYDEELPDEQIVHNLEHGNVVISYNLTDPEEVRRFEEVVGDLSGLRIWGVVRPYSKLEPGEVAMTAWGVIDKFQGVDKARMQRFFETYRGYRGAPELIPCNTQ